MPSRKIAIKVDHLSKQYRLGGPQEQYHTIRDAIVNSIRAPMNVFCKKPHEEGFWALKEVSFEVEQGEVVGIIGRNGAGKSTLLKILSRITTPTEGTVELHGRVGSLLEVGTGFHPELTGRENIYLNGAVLGMKKAEIDRKFDEIVAFAETEKFLDTPVKRYSSGMYARLAFAVAAHLEPEILLVDEVLAVGDAAFQKKCLGKMGDVAKEGRTVLFVSHNMAAIDNLCPRSVLLEQGNTMADSKTRNVIDLYLQKVLEPGTSNKPLSERADRSGDGRVRFTSFHIEDTNRKPIRRARSGSDLVLVFGFECCSANQLKNVDIGFSIHSTLTNQTLAVLYSSYLNVVFECIPKRGFFRCKLERFPFAAGRYRIGARITVNGIEADWPRDGIGVVEVEQGDFYGTGRAGFSGDVPFMLDGVWHAIEPSQGN